MGEDLLSSSQCSDRIHQSKRRFLFYVALAIAAVAGLTVAPNVFAERIDVTVKGQAPIADTHPSGFYQTAPTTYDERIRAAVGRSDFTAATALAKEQMQRGAEPRRGELNLAWIYSKRGDWRAASAAYRQMLVDGAPRPSLSRELLADVYQQLGQCDTHLEDDRSARQNLAKALELRASADNENGFAWLLATSHNDTVRDGHLALLHAKRACTFTSQSSSDPNPIDTLAAAEAELGDFRAAIASEQIALRLLAREAGSGSARDDRLIKFQRRLAGYQANKPYRAERGD